MDIGEPVAVPAVAAPEEKPEKKLTVAFSTEKCRCGDEIKLLATSQNLTPNAKVNFELKQEGKTVAVDDELQPITAQTPWKSKAATDKMPEPVIELSGKADGVSATADKPLLIEKYSDIASSTKTIVCRSGKFGWTGKFDVCLAAGKVIVTVKIKLLNRNGSKPPNSGDPLPAVDGTVSAADKAAMKADIEGKLSGKNYFHRTKCARSDACDCPKERCCCKATVQIIVEFVESGEHHQVNLFQGPGRANATNWTRVKTRDNSYAHETGHLLGWYDEYAGGAVGAAPRWKIQTAAVMNVGLTVPKEYYWDFRDWLQGGAADILTVIES